MRTIDADVNGHSPRGTWADVPDDRWRDWTWQLRHQVRTLDRLGRCLRPTVAEREGFDEVVTRFPLGITPYYAALMDPYDPSCPIRRQAVPQRAELAVVADDLSDPLGEERFLVAPGLVHRYPDRALLYASHLCPVYCRHCTRRRKVSDPGSALDDGQLEQALAYLREHSEVRDVLVSGGDPLMLPDERLDALLGQLRAIPHIEIVRLCTRFPATLPFRFTPALLRRLARHQPLLLHTQFNHPRECTPEAARCLRAIADAGINTANQMVLLAGVNDHAAAVRRTNRWLLRQRCRPYYLLQADLAEGTAHLRTSVEQGLAIIKALRGHVSGPAVPHYVIDAPGGGGKITLVPDWVEGVRDGKLVFRNYLGERYEYPW